MDMPLFLAWSIFNAVTPSDACKHSGPSFPPLSHEIEVTGKSGAGPEYFPGFSSPLGCKHIYSVSYPSFDTRVYAEHMGEAICLRSLEI